MTAKSESRPHLDCRDLLGGASFIFVQILPPEASELSINTTLFLG